MMEDLSSRVPVSGTRPRGLRGGSAAGRQRMAAVAPVCANADPHGIDPAALRAAVRRVLVVDDSKVQRRILRAYLTTLGYEVIEARTGREAVQGGGLAAADLVIADWLMPEMDGLELCHAARTQREGYLYFILLTSRSSKEDVAHGLEAGADDFLAKPVGLGELRARIAAGARILHMHRALRLRAEETRVALDRISQLYDAIDRDLVEARRLQLSLIREPHSQPPEGEVALILQPAGRVGGDLVGSYPIGRGGLGLYGIDVSGHGVAAALLSARLAGHFAGGSPERNIALKSARGGGVRARDVAEVAAELNLRMLDELDSGHHFSMLLAHVDLASGRVSYVQAGHPGPLLLGRDGGLRQLGEGGLPVGLLSAASWQRAEVVLKPGERLLIVSDGFAECLDPRGRFLGEGGLAKLVTAARALRGRAFLHALVTGLSGFAAGREIIDDLSAVLFEYHGPRGLV